MEYSQIIKNQQDTKDLFNRLKRRGERVNSALDFTRKKFYRSYKQNMLDINMKRHLFELN